MATNGGAHKFNKNDNNWLHKHFEPQQVDAIVSSISILYRPGKSECIFPDSSFNIFYYRYRNYNECVFY